jgi:Protein of unknown function (DUF3619)
MMPCDNTLGRKISERLGRQPEVAPHIAFRLSQARASALMHADTPRHTWLQWVEWRSPRFGIGIAVLMLGITFAMWQINNQDPDFAEIDAELLAGELPPSAYLDPAFTRIVFKNGE